MCCSREVGDICNHQVGTVAAAHAVLPVSHFLLASRSSFDRLYIRLSAIPSRRHNAAIDSSPRVLQHDADLLPDSIPACGSSDERPGYLLRKQSAPAAVIANDKARYRIPTKSRSQRNHISRSVFTAWVTSGHSRKQLQAATSTSQVAWRSLTLAALQTTAANAAMKPIVIKSTMVGAGALSMKKDR